MEVGQRSGFTVAVDTAALEEVDHDLVDEVDVATELERMTTLGGGEDIGELDAVLVGFGDAGQRVRHAEGDDTSCDARTGGIGASGLKIATVLEVDLVDGGLGRSGGEAGDEEALVIARGTIR